MNATKRCDQCEQTEKDKDGFVEAMGYWKQRAIELEAESRAYHDCLNELYLRLGVMSENVLAPETYGWAMTVRQIIESQMHEKKVRFKGSVV